MFKIGDKLVYKRDVCLVKDIKVNKYTNINCYVLSLLSDDSLTINAPTDNRMGYLRELISKKEVEQLIDEIPNIKPIECNNHLIENEYKSLFHSGNHKDLIRIIKTTYLRNKERKDNNRNVGEKDKEYFNKAEKYLYNELSVVLGLSYDETKKYVIEKVGSKL